MYLNSITKMLRTVLEVRQLKDIIMREFPLFGIKSCYISVYHKNGNNGVGSYSEIIVAYEYKRCIEYSDDKRIFPSDELIPGGNSIGGGVY